MSIVHKPKAPLHVLQVVEGDKLYALVFRPENITITDNSALDIDGHVLISGPVSAMEISAVPRTRRRR